MDLEKRPRRESSKLGLAGVALLGTLATNHADAASDQLATVTPRYQKNLDVSETRGDPTWFRAKLNTFEHISATELRKMEKMVMGSDIPLQQQVSFLENSLKERNVHNRELQDTKLTSERLSEIIRLVDLVSSRLTIAYESRDRAPAELKKYFDIHALRDSSRYLHLTERGSEKPSEFCNGFLMRSGNEVYFTTDAHCTMGTTTEQLFFYPSNNQDVAIQYIPQEEFSAWDIKDPGALPELSRTASLNRVSGKVVASFSWGLDPKTGNFDAGRPEEKVHFSFAMPLPPAAIKVMYKVEVDQLPHIKDSAMFIKPHGEGEVVRFDAKKNNAPVIRAGGTSGSVVGVYESGRYSVLGNLQSVARLDDTCRYLCYAVSYSASPNTLRDAISEEQHYRLRGLDATDRRSR